MAVPLLPSAKPVYTCPDRFLASVAVVDPAAGTFGFQPVMFPESDAKINRAGPLAEPEVTTKSLVPFATVPVGDIPGIVIDGMPGCLKKTTPPTSPR